MSCAHLWISGTKMYEPDLTSICLHYTHIESPESRCHGQLEIATRIAISHMSISLTVSVATILVPWVSYQIWILKFPWHVLKLASWIMHILLKRWVMNKWAKMWLGMTHKTDMKFSYLTWAGLDIFHWPGASKTLNQASVFITVFF